MLELRDYQDAALDMLREAFKDGHTAILLYLATGGGKTEIAIAMLEACRAKGTRAAMLLDRIVLCDQTSQRLDKYKIDHGVLQSGHWRYRPHELIQVCSAQTIEKRGEFPGLSLLIIDECHQTRSATLEFIKNNPHIKVIGLSASPFTKGLGSIYSHVVSPITTKKLVDAGSLVPLRVFVAKEIDMEGAKKVAGEWSQDEVTSRGKKITGDIVAEWVKKTHEVFGKPEKTIVFCAGVDHGIDLQQKFQEQGYNFVSISYRDDNDFKRDIIDDFNKPDSDIVGLIATDILTKGFDSPAVKIGVSARPFSKSLSSHIQQMGRVMRTYPGKTFGLWLDHSGNYLRFREDWEDVFENGVSELEDGKEKTKKELDEKEKKEAKCPACGALWPRGSDTCAHCGHVRERKSMVQSVPGEMQELGAMSREDKQKWWSMGQYMVQSGSWAEGRAKAVYKSKFGVWPNGLHSQPLPPSREFERFARKSLIAYLKGKR